MRRIRHQRVAVEILREQPLAERDRFVLLHLVEAGALPYFFGRLDDKRGGFAVVTVGVGLEPAVLGLFEGEGEGVEQLLRPQPDETTTAVLDLRLECLRVALADAAVEAVGADHQVGARELRLGADIGLEHQLHAQFFASRLQDVEQPLAADAAEAVTAGADRAALEMDVDVVPVIEAVEDLQIRRRVCGLQVFQRLVRKHHAPAERVVRSIAFDDGDVVDGVRAPQQQRKIQPRRSAPNADNTHSTPSNRNWGQTRISNPMIRINSP